MKNRYPIRCNSISKQRTLTALAFLMLLNLGLLIGGGMGCGGSFIPPTALLTVNVTGAGLGTITSNTGGINCKKTGGTCQANLAIGTQITLTGVSDKGFFFNGWFDSPCTGVTPCVITLNSDLDISGSFINVAFQSDRALDGSDATNDVDNIWTINSDGANPVHLTDTASSGGPSDLPQWSPDGNHLLFVGTKNLSNPAPDAPPNDKNNLWVVNANDGSSLIPLTHLVGPNGTVEFYPPDWSPDGTQATYGSTRNLTDLSSNAPANGVENIWIVNTDGSGGDLALTKLEFAGSFDPQWSPDGTKIVYESFRNLSDLSPTASPNPCLNIWATKADGSGGDQALTQNDQSNAGSVRPVWSPDGTRIAYESNRNLTDLSPTAPGELSQNIWVMLADGSNPMPLTFTGNGLSNNRIPQWSADGSHIVFVSDRNLTNPSPTATPNPELNIWSVKADGSENPFPLTATMTVNNIFPIFAVDGTAVIFESPRDLNPAVDAPNPNATSNIWIVNPDGSGELPITNLLAPNVSNRSPWDFD